MPICLKLHQFAWIFSLGAFQCFLLDLSSFMRELACCWPKCCWPKCYTRKAILFQYDYVDLSRFYSSRIYIPASGISHVAQRSL